MGKRAGTCIRRKALRLIVKEAFQETSGHTPGHTEEVKESLIYPPGNPYYHDNVHWHDVSNPTGMMTVDVNNTISDTINDTSGGNREREKPLFPGIITRKQGDDT